MTNCEIRNSILDIRHLADRAWKVRATSGTFRSPSDLLGIPERR